MHGSYGIRHGYNIVGEGKYGLNYYYTHAEWYGLSPEDKSELFRLRDQKKHILLIPKHKKYPQ